jgi:hypothetical protein
MAGPVNIEGSAGIGENSGAARSTTNQGISTSSKQCKPSLSS